MANINPQLDPARYKETTREQWQAAAEAWHRWGPTLEQWLGPATEVMLDMAGLRTGSRVLDVACGAGGQTVAAAKRVGLTGYVLATDISSNILQFAGESARQAGLKNMETRMADGEALNMQPDSFDAVISRLGLMYFPNVQGALASMHRALKSGGKMAAMVLSTAEKNGFFSVPISVIRRRAKLPPPPDSQPGPFSLGRWGVLEERLLRAGFREVQSRLVAAPLRMASASECARFEREFFGALHQMLSGLDEVVRKAAWLEVEHELARFEGLDGFEATCELLVGVGIK